ACSSPCSRRSSCPTRSSSSSTGAASTSTPCRSKRIQKESAMEFFRQTNIDFLKYKWWAIGASWLLIALGVFTVFVQKGLKFGIDFSGGTAIAVRFAERPDIDHLRKVLDGAGLGEIGIQRYEEAEKNEVLIRVQQQATEGRDVAGDAPRPV